jgi:hypothetical protein
VKAPRAGGERCRHERYFDVIPDDHPEFCQAMTYMHSNQNFFGISWYFFFPLEEIPIEVAVSRAHKGISFSHWEKYLT